VDTLNYERLVSAAAHSAQVLRQRLANRLCTLVRWLFRHYRLTLGLLLRLPLIQIERETGLSPGVVSRAPGVRIARRGNEFLILVVDQESDKLHVKSGITLQEAVDNIRSGIIERVILITRSDSGFQHFQLPRLLLFFRRFPNITAGWLERLCVERTSGAGTTDVLAAIRAAQANVAIIDFLAPDKLPFTERMPSYVWAEPTKRSVVLLNNCYYYYEVLAAALRRRGWEVRTASFVPPDSPSRQFYWNREEIIYDPDPVANRQKAAEFFTSIVERFGAVQFYGQHQMSCFPENWSFGGAQSVPWDFLEMRRRGIIIGYTPSGCLDGARQSSIRRISTDVCGRCVWENQPNVCSDHLNGRWAQQLDLMCDWIGLENDYAVDERTASRYVRRPVVSGLDPSIWNPDLEVPERFKVHKEPGEILIYHVFANSHVRRSNGRDLKGSGAVIAAVERLKSEGLPIRLFYATDIPTTEVRFYQVQADIVVDQLNYGRLGSNAREALMLGRPLVTRIEPKQEDRAEPLDTMATVPVCSADENTIYDVLRRLAGAPETLREMGRQSREYALKWHRDDVCAARFEKVVDRVRAGLPADIDEYPEL
jgi:hypothetical protein